MININESKIAITGASGYIGERLVKQLLKLGAEVSTLVRNKGSLDYTIKKQVRVIEGNLKDIEGLATFIDNCDVVYHLAAYVHKPTITQYQIENCYEINYLGTKRLVDICLEQSQPPFFVFFSTVSVYGSIDGELVEDQKCNPITKYGETKFAAENYLLAKIESGELQGCILRPSVIIGENAPGNFSKLIKMIDVGIIPSFDGGLNRKSIAYVDDVVQGAITAIEKSQLSNHQIYNIAHHNSVQMNEIIQMIGSTLEKKPMVMNLPMTPIFFLAELWDKFAILFSGKLPQIKRSLETYTSDVVVNTEKIQEQLGYRPAVPIKEGISRMVVDYKRIKLT